MLKLSNLKPQRGSKRRTKVVGRGVGSGHGTFSGRGAKGQKARAGSSIPIGFEGGRMPLHRQLPKRRGFTSHIPKAVVIDFQLLESKFNAGDIVNPKVLFNKGLVGSATDKVKILANGELKKKLTFEKVEISKKAQAMIEKAGGKIITRSE